MLIMMGGAEDKTGPKLILRALANRIGKGKLVVATLASQEPDRQWERYSRVFHELGVTDVHHLYAESREQISDPSVLNMLEGAAGVFFTGGDQLQITTKLGGTAAYDKVRSLYKREGAVIAGTSAGAAAMGQVMLMATELPGAENHTIRQAFMMARGLSLIRDMVIDQHFAQRARIERLIGAIAENPSVLGVGIDEDTAIIVDWQRFDVIGTGAVYVADGSNMTYTNLPERGPDSTLCLYDVRLHVLAAGSAFDMEARRPLRSSEGRLETPTAGKLQRDRS
jgi:cyanophycinase